MRILASNRSLYQQINDQFLAPGRYLRIAGNHDQDLQEPALLERLRTVYPGLPTPHDFVIIEPSKGDRSPFVIGHGHHFDLSCTPKYAPRLGESYSVLHMMMG